MVRVKRICRAKSNFPHLLALSYEKTTLQPGAIMLSITFVLFLVTTVKKHNIAIEFSTLCIVALFTVSARSAADLMFILRLASLLPSGYNVAEPTLGCQRVTDSFRILDDVS